MEKEKIFGADPPHLNWHPSQVPASEMNCGPSDQLTCFLNLNWDHSMDQSVQFDSALSSIVSSPSNPAPPADSVVIRELIGRLGSICNSGEISPQSHQYMSRGNNSTNTSCYSTPLNSPPKLNLSIMDHHPQARGNFPISGNLVPSASHLQQFATDPGFAERAARFSCFSGRNYGGLPETGKLSRVSSSQSLKAGGFQLGVSDNNEIMLQNGSQMEMEIRPTQDVEFGSGREESSVSDQIATGGEMGLRGHGESNARKRKAASRGKAKDIPSSQSTKDLPKMAEEDLNGKRSKSAETSGTGKDEVKLKVEQNGGVITGDGGQKQGKENNSKPPEPPKQDYIHVRARRGQATDSHSLAERVRREKISERMKFLQDLVPGCNKVTGKAVMLDEIINYVQSLQRQVEFLSMKLATVNPRLDINVESLLPKDMHQSRGPFPHSVYPFETCASPFSFAHQPQPGTPLQSIVTNGLETQCFINPLDSTHRRTLSMQLTSIDGIVDAASQLGSYWDNDLHSVVHMGFGQDQEPTFSSQGFHGTLPASNMKIEL